MSTGRTPSQRALLSDDGGRLGRGCEGAAVDCFYPFGLCQQPQSSKCDCSQPCFSSLQTPVSWHDAEVGKASSSAHKHSASWGSTDHRREVKEITPSA